VEPELSRREILTINSARTEPRDKQLSRALNECASAATYARELLDPDGLRLWEMASSISHDLRHYLSAVCHCGINDDGNLSIEREELMVEVQMAVRE